VRLLKTFLLFSIAAGAAFSQVTTTARLDGTVTDPQGASVPGAQVEVVQTATGQNFHAVTDDKGYWALPSLQTGGYKVTVTHTGFRSATNGNVTLDAGVPATVKVTLEVGAATETVEVTAGAEIVQSTSATVSSTLQGGQINDLPFTSHNVTELIASQPGTQSADGVRYATINGLPQTTINITIDGINVQDNATKSNPDAIFSAVQARTQAIEEMTMSTAAANADSSGEGAVQIKFVTKGGSNQFHGGLYETNRNSYFEACYFFNCLQHIAKDQINLNEYGFTIGGPVVKNKLFFFESFEFFDLPQTFSESQMWLTPTAATGVFQYNVGGVTKSVNLLTLAAAENPSLPAGTRPFPTVADPTMAKTYALINQLTNAAGTLASRVANNNDYNRNNYSSNTKAVNNRKFQTSRIDYNITEKHHLNFVWNYQTNDRTPDGLNLEYAILPGTGTQLGSPDLEGQYGINWTGSIGLRSVVTTNIVNELTAGIQGGANALGDGLSPNDYSIWNGKLVSFGAAAAGSTTPYMSNPYNGNYTNYAPRSTPVYQINDNVSYLKGKHLLNFGGNFTQVNAWQAAANSSLLNTVTLGQATGDPDNTGATSLFTTNTLPGASSTQLSDAANLYAVVAGRISAITSSAVLGEQSKTYGANFAVDRDRLREFASYVQDTWRATSHLTIVLGVRWDRQGAIRNLDNLYTRPGYAGLFGVSGVGNLFQPGVLAGSAPVFSLVPPGVGGFDPGVGHFNPSFGIAYVIPKGVLHWLTGDEAVLRGGFNLSTLRQGMGFLDGVWNGNQGRSLSTSSSPGTTPSIFPAGSVLFSDASYPSLVPSTIDAQFPNPSFPLAVQSGQSVEDYNPSIKPEYVESWTLGFQRPLGRNTSVEFRYVANHGVDLWSAVNLNEVNTVENNFAQQFQAAQNNLAIANGISVAQLLLPTTKLTVNNYSDTGLPGQNPVPLITVGIGSNVDQTTITQLQQGQAGATANAIATNATRMANLTKAGYPINIFQVNPNNGGNSTEMTNRNSSTYNSGQVEVRRRLAAGLQMQASYAFSKSLTDSNTPTLRDWGGNKGPTTFDIRNGFKMTWIYQLPFGQGRSLLSGAHGVLGKVVSGWEIAGVGRVQSGTPINIVSGRDTFNQNDGGVVLHNMTAKQLQNDVGLNFTSQVSASGVTTGTAYYLPQALLQNTLAAFNISGTFVPTAPYIGPCNTAGQICDQVFLWGPWFSKWDASLVKRTQIKERLNLEFRAEALNVFNHPNILVPGGAATGGNINATVNSSFGQTTSAFRDLNNTNDPGARSLEFVMRLNF
jgi:hypothetical protein